MRPDILDGIFLDDVNWIRFFSLKNIDFVTKKWQYSDVPHVHEDAQVMAAFVHISVELTTNLGSVHEK